ncbi:tetratricopeptide repeat protein [Flavobacteriaceae bacterium]|nr:tetratricopeptide repeat protein [Flavobacteriaceae bacterium]
MRSVENSKWSYQKNKIKTLNLGESDKVLKVRVTAGSGVEEKIFVVDDEAQLSCTMAWNTGEYEYEIPAKKLLSLLNKMPFDTIGSNELGEYDFELIKNNDGELSYQSVNGIEIYEEDKIIESLKGTKHEIKSGSNNDDKYDLIAEKMRDLYSNGDIGDSEYSFSSLFSLEFEDEEFGSFFIDWHYEKKLITDGDNLREEEKYEEAISVYNDYIALKFNKSLDEVFRENKLSEKGLKDLKQIAKGFAICFEGLNDYENASTNYKLLIPHTPDSSYNHAHLAYCCLKLKHYEDSEKHFSRAIEINSSNIWAISWYADTLIDQNKIDEAIKVLNEGVENNPRQPSGQMSIFWLFRTRGDVLYDLKKWEEAIESYLKASEIDSDNAFTFLRLGFAYFNTKNYHESYSSFELCQEKNSDYKDANIYYHKGECKRNLKNYESAIEQFDFSINKNSEEYTPWAYKMKGNCFLKLNDFSNAADSYGKGHKDKWTYHNLGKAHYGMAKYDLALENFKKVVEIDPKYKWAYHWMGDALFELEEYEKALETYEKLIERDDSYIYEGDTYHILHNLALLYHFKGEYEKANIFYKQDDGYNIRKEGLWWHYCKKTSESNQKGSLFISPKNIKHVGDKTIENIDDKNLLSKTYLSRGGSEIYHYGGENGGKLKLDMMISDLNKSLLLDSSNHKAYFNRAACLSRFFNDPPYRNARENDVDEKDKSLLSLDGAIDDLKAFLKIENKIDAHKLLIKCYSKKSDLKNLKAVCDKAVSLFESDYNLNATIGRAWKDNSEFANSISAFKKGVEIKPENPWAYKSLGEVYLLSNDIKNAIKSFKKAESFTDNEMVNYWLSKAYLADGQIDLAHLEINKAINSYSGDKSYFIQYAKVCGEKHKKQYPKIGKIMLEYVEKAAPHSGRTDEVKKNQKEFLDDCDSFGAGQYGNYLAFGDLFELWEHFLDVDIESFIINGCYRSKHSLSKNPSLNKSQVLELLNHGAFSVLDNTAASKLLELDDIKNIMDSDDGTYHYSYKLLGLLSNPNINNDSIEKLRNNRFSWVRMKVFSIINNYKDEDLKDKYKVLGLIENQNIDSKLKEKLKTSLLGLETNKYTLKFGSEGASTLEYVYGEFDLDEMAEHISKSLNNFEESWSEYCRDNWYDFGESEYGLNESSIDIKIEVEDKQEEEFTLNFGSKIHDTHLDSSHNGLSKGSFAHVATSYESGEYGFANFELEFEFRPEKINLETTDYKGLISGIEYSGSRDEDYNYSQGELINTTTHGTDITLYYKTEDNLIDVTSYDNEFDGYTWFDQSRESFGPKEEDVKKHFVKINEGVFDDLDKKWQEEKAQDIKQLIKKVDMDVLGEIMRGKAESIQYSDYNIVVFNIEAQDLEGGAFEKMEETGRVKYGDWNMLGGIISEEEVNKIKKDFTEDLKRLKDDDENEVEDLSQIYMSFLYCEGVYVWSASRF